MSFAVAGFFVGDTYEGQKDAGEDELDVDSSDPAFSTYHERPQLFLKDSFFMVFRRVISQDGAGRGTVA